MKEEKEREIYWEAVGLLDEIIKARNKSREELLADLEEDLEE